MSQNTPDFAIVDLKATTEIVRRAPSTLTLGVYVVVRGRTNNPQQGWRMTVRSLAEDLGCSTRSIQRSIAWLEEEGFLLRRRRGLASGRRVVAAGLGARELEADYYAPQQPIPLTERCCLAPRTSLGWGHVQRCLSGERSDERTNARTGGRTRRRTRARTCRSVSERAFVRPSVRSFVRDNSDGTELCDQMAGGDAILADAAPAVENHPQPAPKSAPDDLQGVTTESPLPQKSKDELSPMVPTSGRLLKKSGDLPPPEPPPIAEPKTSDPSRRSALAADQDFGMAEVSAVDGAGRRRRAVTTEMVDILVSAVLDAVESAPEGGWLYRCRYPDVTLIGRAVDNLKVQRDYGRYAGSLCKRTIQRALRRVWRLCEHLPQAQLRPETHLLGEVT